MKHVSGMLSLLAEIVLKVSNRGLKTRNIYSKLRGSSFGEDERALSGVYQLINNSTSLLSDKKDHKKENKNSALNWSFHCFFVKSIHGRK